MKSHAFGLVCGLTSVAGCGVLTPWGEGGITVGGGTDGAEKSYNIQENTQYEVFDCFSTPVNEITHLFEDELTPTFAGTRFHDGSENCLMGDGSECPLPSFAVDSTLSLGIVDGRDDLQADAASLFVYAGHAGSTTVGGPRLQYTILDPGNAATAGCLPSFQSHVRLGHLGGGKARIGIYAASCVGAGRWFDAAPAPANSWAMSFSLSRAWQHLTFLDSPDLDDNELQLFAQRVKDGGFFGAESNLSAWLAETNYAYGSGAWNQPVVITAKAPGESDEELIVRHEEADFFTLNQLPPTSGSLDDFVVDDDKILGDGLHDPYPSSCEFY